jgi:hypothetical protein
VHDEIGAEGETPDSVAADQEHQTEREEPGREPRGVRKHEAGRASHRETDRTAREVERNHHDESDPRGDSRSLGDPRWTDPTPAEISDEQRGHDQ